MRVRASATSLIWTLVFWCLLLASLTPGRALAYPGGGSGRSSASPGSPTPQVAFSAPLTATATETTTATVTATGVATATASATAPVSDATPAPATVPPATATATPRLTITPTATAAAGAADPAPSPTSTSTPAASPSATAQDTPVAAQATPAPSSATAVTATAAQTGSAPPLPLAFEPNRGQTDPRVQYLAHAGAYTLFLAGGDATLALVRPALGAAGANIGSGPSARSNGSAGVSEVSGPGITATAALSTAAVLLQHVGAAAAPTLAAQDALPGVVNYLIGADPSHWHTGIPTYSRVTVHALYPGIDLLYDGAQGRLETTYVVAPGADPSAITLALSGTQGLRLDAQGDLVLATAAGPLTETAPLAYQQEADGARQPVAAAYALHGAGRVGFTLGAYDPSQPLYIDPVLVYAAEWGGNGADQGNAVGVDAAGNAYVAGVTASTNFPTVSPISSTGGPAYSDDGFVSKVNAAGTALLYSTYLGGSDGATQANGIAVDATGQATVAGQTTATTFPTTAGAYQTSAPGGGHTSAAFVSTLNAAGTGFVSSTYLGGSGGDAASGVARDASGNTYVTGQTSSTNFPTTADAAQPTAGGGGDAFVAVLNASGTTLTYGSYLGGSGADSGAAIAVDTAGVAYVTGSTSSADFPQLHGLGRALGGTSDAFVAAIDTTPGGGALRYGTLLGGSGADSGAGIALAGPGRVAVAGSTTSSDFPTTVGAYQTSKPSTGSATAAFAATLDTSQSGSTALSAATYLGGSGSDAADAVAADGRGDVYLTGGTTSPNFPLTALAYQRTNAAGGANSNAFLTELDPALAAPLYSTYLGGFNGETGYGLALDGGGGVFLTGVTELGDFGGLQSLGGGRVQDVLLARFVLRASGQIPWHPHQSVQMSDGLSAQVDLADGHVDVQASALDIPALGPDLRLVHTWDSTLAQAGAVANEGQGWVSDLRLAISGDKTSALLYHDASGATWPFTETGVQNGVYSYQTPPGQPWQLTASSGYTLTNILSGETWHFDQYGNDVADTDAYGNANSYAQGGNGPAAVRNSGGPYTSQRQITLYYSHGLLSTAISPAGGQQVAYGYTGTAPSAQMTSLTRGAGTPDALTETFGYSGTQMISVTTPYTSSPQFPHTWSLGYDGSGRLTSITSPISGTPGQAGYTPAYTTTVTYGVTQTQVVQGAGTTSAETTTYTLDDQGEATATQDGDGNTNRATYDQDHDVLTATDANGNTTTNSYQYVGPNGSTGLLTRTVKPSLSSYLVPGNASGPVTTTNVYNGDNDLVETDRAEGGLTLYAYDGAHSVITTTELVSASPVNCTQFAPQRGAQPPSLAPGVPEVLGCHYVFQWRANVQHYDAYGERIAAIDGRGVPVDNTASFTSADPHDSLPTVVFSPTLAAPYTHNYGYDPQGDQTSESTPPITTTLNGATTASMPVTTTYTYDGDGNRTGATSANDNTTTYGYDHLGRPISTTLPQVTLYNRRTVAPTETTRYDGDGNIVQQVDANGDVTTSSYDPWQRTVATTDPVSGTTIMTYSTTEQVATQDPQGNVARSVYDGAGRLISTTDSSGGMMQYQYDAAGNTTALTSTTTGSAVSQVETRGYDAQDEMIRDSVGAPGATPLTTLTAYDRDGNTVQTEQPNGDTVYDSYDLVDQRIAEEIDPAPVLHATGPSYSTYSYDAAGNVTSQTDADGRTQATVYDGDARMVQAVESYTPTVALTTTPQYDPDGNMVQQQVVTATAGSATTTNAYNAADWLITTTETSSDGATPLTTVYGYDAAGQQRSESILDRQTPVTTLLDPEGRATSMSENADGTGPYTSTFGYYPTDLPMTATLPDGVQEHMTYDGSDRLTYRDAAGPPSAPNPLNSSYDYRYDPATGWTTELTGTVNTLYGGQPTPQMFTHDGQGRLIHWQWPTQANLDERWSYDGNGNVITNTEYIDGAYRTTYYTYTASSPNELQEQHTDGLGVESYTYDQYGNTTSLSATDPLTGTYGVSTTLGYDSQARPIGIRVKSQAYSTAQQVVFSTVSFGYNAQGQRASYTVSTPGYPGYRASYHYRDDGPNVAQAVVTSGTVTGTVTYTDTYLYDQQGAPYELLRQYQGQSIQRYWYELDGQGDVVALTDGSGNVVDRYAYDPWGEGLAGTVSEQVPQPLRYRGYWWDQELGWYWVNVRSYDPEGHWLQPDPSQQDGVLTYAYVGDDPIDYTDPTGLRQYIIWAAAFIAPSTIHFIDPARGDLNALVHGDGRGFWNGIGPIPWQRKGRPSSRIWNYVVVDDNPSASPVVKNLSGVGRSEIWYHNLTGSGGPDFGYAKNPALATVKRYTDNRGHIHTWVVIQAASDIPIVKPYSPPIQYQYILDFDPEEGKLTVFGTHTAYPWQELLIKEGGQVISGKGSPWQFTPAKGATPISLLPYNGNSLYAVPWASVVTLNIPQD